MNGLWNDSLYAFRQLRRKPGLAMVVILALALGIGANTAVFSVLNGWLLRPLPVPSPQQIMVLAPQQKDGPQVRFSFPDLVDFRRQADTFSAIFAYQFGAAGLSFNGRPNEFVFSAVTGNYFSALGVKPVLGRFLLPGEGETPGDPLLVVLGFSYWQRRLGGDPNIIGKQVLFNGKPGSVIGVAPEEFHGSLFAFNMDGYVPLNTLARGQKPAGFWSERGDRELFVQARLKPGVSLAQARSSVAVIAARLGAQYPATNKDIAVRVIPENLARPAPLVASFAPVIFALFLTLAGLVLLLAAMNVAGVLLSWATARQREMAIRTAVGAGRARLMRQVLTESVLVAAVGGLSGALIGNGAISLAGWLLHSVTTTPNFGYQMDCRFDWKVFAYTLGATVMTGVLAGWWPALRASRTDVIAVMHGSAEGAQAGRRRPQFRSFLIIGELAGSLMLLIAAGLFVRSLLRAESMYLGFNPSHVLTMLLDPQQIGFDQTRTETFYRELEQRVRAVPGVQAASLAFSVPLEVPSRGSAVYVEGRALGPGEKPASISYNSVSPAYFETMRIPLLRGRPFAESDAKTSLPVAIVSETMAKKLWPNQDCIGKRFSLKGTAGPFVEVVGVSADGQYMFVSPERQPYFYLPLAQDYSSFRSLQVRTSLPPESLISAVQGQIAGLAPDLPFIDVRTMEQVVQGLGGLFIFRLAAFLAGVMGALGLILSVVGVYGIVSFSVGQRTREIGIRMALGAARADILSLVSRQGLKLIGVGVGLGLLAAWALTRAMAKLLIGVRAADPFTFLGVSMLLAGVTWLACYIPARRATRVDPMVALRYE